MSCTVVELVSKAMYVGLSTMDGMNLSLVMYVCMYAMCVLTV